MSNIRFIFDDSVRVPAEIAGLGGISRFGRLIYKRRPLARRSIEAAQAAGIEDVVHLTSMQDLEALRDRASQRTEATRYLYYPSNLVASDNGASLVTFLAKLRYADHNLRLDAVLSGGWTGIVLMRPEIFRRFLDALLEDEVSQFMAANSGGMAPIENKIGFLDLRAYSTFIEYLTSNFEVRHFNSIAPEDRYTLVKRSRNKEKIRSEFSYFQSIPDDLKRFFIQPFDYQESADAASYRMERALIPDMALQWIHGSLTEDEFAALLDRVFHYLALRPAKATDAAQARAWAAAYYVDKLEARIAQLRTMPVFGQLDSWVLSGGAAGGLAGLVERFRRLYDKLYQRGAHRQLVMSHGDLCFSNILYDKGTRIIKFIDPRGATSADGLYMDPYYDVAKLSHSVLGLYDYINNGLFTISVDVDLALDLSCEMADRGAEQALFRQHLAAHGFDGRLTRLYEASLFLSMLPLHSEGPQKLLAFALTAARILDELES